MFRIRYVSCPGCETAECARTQSSDDSHESLRIALARLGAARSAERGGAPSAYFVHNDTCQF